MLIDGRALPDGERLETDLCIIGAGAAGISLALAFAGRGVAVCLVESGGFEFEEEVQGLNKAEHGAIVYESMETRLRMFGGTTGHWGGFCRPLDDIDFEARPWVPHSGWPFGRAELDPYYLQATRLVEVGTVFEAEALQDQLAFLPVGGAEETLCNAPFQISPPTRFGEVYRQPLLDADNVTILLHANVVDFELASVRIERVHLTNLVPKRFTIEARCFVLAASGIENARLLLVAARAEAGIANTNDLVGRYFMDHPHYSIGALTFAPLQWDPSLYLSVDHSTGDAINTHLCLAPAAQAEAAIGNAYFQLRPRIPSEGEKSFHLLMRAFGMGDYPEDLGRHLQAVLADLGAITGVVGNKLAQRWFGGNGYGETLALRFVGEQVPNPDSRVMLADTTDAIGLPKALIDWRLNELDWHTMRKSGEILATAMGRLGLGRVRLDPLTEATFDQAFVEWGYHQIGTTRMDDDPKQGVVDRHCRHHLVSNLYVAGSSVFPTGGGGTPTFTIVALALRLAEYLKTHVFQ